MNQLAFVITTLSLGAMAGISGSHYFQVKTMVENHEKSTHKPMVALTQATLPVKEAVPAVDTTPVIIEAPAEEAVAATEPEIEETAPQSTNETLEAQMAHQEALLKILENMRAEQKAMRKQLADTNRDLAEANFRLDTHSDSFKPLRIESAAPRSLNTRVYELDVDNTEQLLPPK